MMFLDCPAYLDQDGAMRCGLPAEVRCRFTMRSSAGPIDSAMIRCPAGHHFTGAIESLTWDGKDNHDPGMAGAGSSAGSDSVQHGHDGRDDGGGSDLRDAPAIYPMKPSSAAATQPRTPGCSSIIDFPSQARGHRHEEGAPWVSE